MKAFLSIIILCVSLWSVRATEGFQCPQCRFLNEPSDRYCLDCGHEMKSLTEEDKQRLQTENQERQKSLKRAALSASKILKVVKQGEAVDLQKYAVPGGVTLFDFTAEWCGPCKKLGPQLEKFVLQTENVYLRVIDIKSFGSPVAKQHKIQGIPAVWIYDPHLKLNKKIVGQKMAVIRDTVNGLIEHD